MGFRSLSPAYDIWTLDASPTSDGNSRRMMFSPTSMLNGLEPFSPTTIREVSDLNILLSRHRCLSPKATSSDQGVRFFVVAEWGAAALSLFAQL